MTKSATNAPHLLDRMAGEGIDTSHLKPVGTRPAFDEYLAELWQRRHFIWVDSRKRVASKYSNSKLGRAWFILQPLLDVAFYGILFGLVLKVSRGMENYIAFVIIGTMMFRSSGMAFSSGAGAIQGAKPMIRAFSFPRAAIPVSLTTRAAVESIPTLLVVLVLIMAIPPHELPGWGWLLLPVIWLLQMALNLGIMFITSRLGQILPDAGYILGFISRFLMYGSGVIFPIDQFLKDHRTVLFILELNPLYQILTMYRLALMDNAMPTAFSWIVVLVWTVLLVVGGGWFFWRGEATYGR